MIYKLQDVHLSEMSYFGNTREKHKNIKAIGFVMVVINNYP